MPQLVRVLLETRFMHRSLAASLVLLAIIRSPALAQTCMGMASFTGAPMLVTASGSVSGFINGFGASAGYGTSSSVYGSVGLSTTSYEAIDGSTLGVGAHVGFQRALGNAGQIQVCPNVSVGLGIGPNDDVASVNQSSRSASVGLSVGTVLGANPRMRVVPSVGLSYAYDEQKAENDAGTTLFEISDSYALAQLRLGIVLNSNISIRPSVDIPIGLDGSEPTFGLTLGYSFGK